MRRFSFATNLAGIFTADFNLDGNLDLAVGHSDDSLTLLFGDGSGGLQYGSGFTHQRRSSVNYRRFQRRRHS